MSAYFSRFGLNTYQGAPYFAAHSPKDYPLSLVLQKSRAFRRLPTNLRELATKAREWSARTENTIPGIENWYDDAGNELDPGDGHVLTDEEIDEQWQPNTELDELEVEDIPMPDGGFPDPNTWEELVPAPDPEEETNTAKRRKNLLSMIEDRGREYVAKDAGMSLDGIESDDELVEAILGR